jgi:AraC-like DNA-binding protein
MLLFLSLTGIILSCILIYFNLKTNRSTLYFGLFFALIGFYGILYYVLFYSGSVFWISLLYVNFTFLTYLIGPMFYFYIRGIVKDNYKLQSRDLWHFTPALFFLIISLPYIFTSWAYKKDIAEHIVRDIYTLREFKPVFLFNYVHPGIIYLSRPVLALIYVVWSLVVFLKSFTNRNDNSILRNQKFMFKWLMLLFFFVFLMIFSHLMPMQAAFIKKDIYYFFTLTVLQLVSGIGLAGLLVSLFFFPEILYGMPRIPTVKKNQNFASTLRDSDFSLEKKKQNADLEEVYIAQIEEKLYACMTEMQPYIQADCNIYSVSVLIKVPVHHMSYFFREVKNQSFNDYRNMWRVKHAKMLIEKNKNKDYTFEAIGELSGFSSKNAFFSAFRRFENMTPGQYAEKF